SLISERRSCRRVAMNSLISCFVSVKAAPSDFSVFTVSPPDAQSNSKHKSERAGNEHDLERIFTDRAIGAKPWAVVSGSDLRTHFADFFCCGVPQLVRAGGCCFSPLVRLGFHRVSYAADAADGFLRFVFCVSNARGSSFARLVDDVFQPFLGLAH